MENIARYRKAVYSALWVQGTLDICYLPYSIAVVLTPQRGMPLSMYLARNFTVSMVLLNSSLNPLLLVVLLEDQRNKASCKRNIKATLLLIELVFWAFQLSVVSY